MKKLFLIFVGLVGCLRPTIDIKTKEVNFCENVPVVLKNYAEGDYEAKSFFGLRKDEIGQFIIMPKNLDDIGHHENVIFSKINNWKFTASGKLLIEYADKNNLLITVSPKDSYGFFSSIYSEMYIINRNTGNIYAYFKISNQSWNKFMIEKNIVYIAVSSPNNIIKYYCIKLIN